MKDQVKDSDKLIADVGLIEMELVFQRDMLSKWKYLISLVKGKPQLEAIYKARAECVEIRIEQLETGFIYPVIDDN